MKLLRTVLISLSVLLVATALAAPGVVGPKVEEVWKQQLGRLRGGEAGAYQRGWFGAETSIDLATEEGHTRLHSEIQHGPLLFTARGPRIGLVYSETRLSVEQLAPALRGQLERFYGRLDHSPLVLESLVGTDNRVVNYLRLEPFTRGDSGGELVFEGAELLVKTDYSGSLLTGVLELGEVRHSIGGRENFHLEQARADILYTPGGDGEATVALPLLRTESDSGPLELRDISLQLDIQPVSAGAIKLASTLQVPQVQSATPVTSLQQQLTLPHISWADLGHYLKALATPAAKRDWQQVLDRPLKLQQQLSVESANGPTLLDADIDWRGQRSGARVVDSGGDPWWLSPLTCDLTFSAAEQALMQSPLIGQATALRQYGLLLENNGELQMHLQVERGRLQVNGQELPADLFLLALTGKF
ncbi:DUF945 family protein [Microbulbifer rhizosphaerae]|uniref:DUF945 domain-containing protein n=1 Tax=Microbulbifer rhizosphaerae TaxID=1562603 RepID=A0A7W4ZAD3_9GAMM|nr:DUF945 family protein [Microbulbifer rhizosphaerae]MBB3062637.1 hypothetical protein [Microbulbifer rhizosphaerae]